MEQMYVRKLLLLTNVALVLLITSCSKDNELSTPEPVPPVPTQGVLQITTDWVDHSEDASVPDTYFFRLNDTTRTVKEKVYTYPSPLNPGKYSLLAYNEAEHITVSGNTASIDTKADGTLAPLPGYLFSAASEVSITAGDTLHTTLKMQQLIHRLTLKLELAAGDEERILRTDALITGIVSSFDLTTGNPVGSEGKNIIPTFSIFHEAKGRAAGSTYLVAILHFPGAMVGEKQHFTLQITLKEGDTQGIETDLTESLKDFGDSDEPLQLETKLSLPVGAGTTANIGEWTRSDEYIEIEDKEE